MRFSVSDVAFFQVKAFSQGLKLNPNADAVMLVHTGMLIPKDPSDALVKSDAAIKAPAQAVPQSVMTVGHCMADGNAQQSLTAQT